jgi:broad specificity phosphatase PhoE
VPQLDTTVFLIHHGITDWHQDGKLLGRRDIPLNEEGKAQARHVAEALDGIRLVELIASPLQRALQTAEVIGKRFDIELARDNRLIDFHLGLWEGKSPEAAVDTPAYQQFLADPVAASMPEGESYQEVKRRAVAAVEQALEDNPSGTSIAIITHARVVRVLLTHYMAAPPATYHRLQINPASISVLSFPHDSSHPRVLAVNWTGPLTTLLAPGEQPV